MTIKEFSLPNVDLKSHDLMKSVSNIPELFTVICAIRRSLEKNQEFEAAKQFKALESALKRNAPHTFEITDPINN